MSPTPSRGTRGSRYIDERRAEPGVEIGIGELNDGDDPSVDLLAKKGLAERLDVSHDLLRRLVATSQDVYFFDVAVAGDDPRGLDSSMRQILSWSAIRSISDQRTVKKGGRGYTPHFLFRVREPSRLRPCWKAVIGNVGQPRSVIRLPGLWRAKSGAFDMLKVPRQDLPGKAVRPASDVGLVPRRPSTPAERIVNIGTQRR